MSAAHLRSSIRPHRIKAQSKQTKPSMVCFSLSFIYSIHFFLSKCEHQQNATKCQVRSGFEHLFWDPSGSSSSSNWLEVLKRLGATWGRLNHLHNAVIYSVFTYIYIYTYVYIYMYCIIWDPKRRAGTWKWYGVYYCLWRVIIVFRLEGGWFPVLWHEGKFAKAKGKDNECTCSV